MGFHHMRTFLIAHEEAPDTERRPRGDCNRVQNCCEEPRNGEDGICRTGYGPEEAGRRKEDRGKEHGDGRFGREV